MKKVKLLILILLSVVCCLSSGSSFAADVKIVGRQLYVNGKLFTVRGVNYGYTPVGGGYRTYDWTIHPENYKKDFVLIKAMGANTIRLHSIPADNAVLDAAYEAGLYVIITASVDWNKNFNDQSARDKVITDFSVLVNRWKNHPALLMWLVGNEINFHTTSLSNWYSLVNECARTAHEIEGANFHPVTTAEANITNLANPANRSDDTNMPDLDLWATQVYMAATTGFRNMFGDYAARSAKPLIITEFGCDAFDSRPTELKENQAAQAQTLGDELTIIDQNLSAVNPDNCCVGAAIFQWADDWSKNFAQNGYNNAVHDTSGDWEDDAYYDANGGNNMNEEWWGLVAITPGTDDKTPRTAYYTVQSLWGPNTVGAASTARSLQTEITNYPNPFKPGDMSTTIVFTVAPQSAVTVKIYDIMGNLVKVLLQSRAGDGFTEYKVKWDGLGYDSKAVANGVYICYVEAAGPSGTDVKYRKILVLK